MSDESGTYLMPCSMHPAQASNVQAMIELSTKFSKIKIDINPHRETYSPLQSEKVSEGEVLVTFCVPCEGVNMADFFGEMCRVLNRESATVRGERL